MNELTNCFQGTTARVTCHHIKILRKYVMRIVECSEIFVHQNFCTAMNCNLYFFLFNAFLKIHDFPFFIILSCKFCSHKSQEITGNDKLFYISLSLSLTVP